MATSKQPNVLRDTLYDLRHIISASVSLSLIYGLLRLSGPLFMILIFDRVLPSRSEATLAALLLLLVVVLTVMTLLDYSRRRILARFGARFQEKIEEHIFSSSARDSYFARNGSKPAAGLNEADSLRGFFHSGSLVTILDFLWAPVFMGILFLIDPIIGWVVTAGIAFLALINAFKMSSEKAREERHDEARDKISELKDSLLVSRHVIESQQMMASYNGRWMLARRSARDSSLELKDWSAWFSIMSAHTAMLIQYVTLAAAAFLTIEGHLTIGTMVASMYLARRVFYPAERFLRLMPNIREAIANWKNLDRILSAGRAPTATLDGMVPLCLWQVKVRSPLTKNVLLRNINLEVAPGSSIEIVGGGGSGKTVLAETLIGRFPRAAGKVLFGTIDVERLSISDATRTVGYIPQTVDFVSGTIEENISGLAPQSDRERIVHVMQLAQMHDKILSLPEGYLTRIDAVGSIFSKGERHRLALARALYPNPKLLIVDEPDTFFRDALANSLKDESTGFLARGGILIVLTRLALKRYNAQRRFTLDDGVLRETMADQISDNKVIRVQTRKKQEYLEPGVPQLPEAATLRISRIGKARESTGE